MNVIDRVLAQSDRLKPAIRRVAPAGALSVLKEAYWRLQSLRIRRLPDRVFLETALLSHFATLACRDVLFVGTRRYTRHYPDLFRRRGITLWTAEIDPAGAQFGNPGHHRTVDVTRLGPDTFPVRFDGVLFSGVVGYGVNDPATISAAFAALARTVRPGAAFVLGWNTDRSVDPLTIPEVGDRFLPWPLAEGGPSRVTFAATTHVYDVLRFKP